MIAAARAARAGAGLAPAFAAVRARLGLVALLVRARRASAGGGRPTRCRAWTTGPWTGLGDARLVPRRLGRDDGGDDVPVGRADGRALLAHDAASARRCAAALRGRLPRSTWARAGLAAFARRRGRRRASPATSSRWDRAGRWVAGATLARRGRLRADAAQGRLPRQVPQPARLPARLLARRARAARCAMGARHGAWCVGCCWALMASLFALGVMSLVWMAFVAGADRGREDCSRGGASRPTGRRRSCSPSACCCSPRPDALPGLTIPGSGGSMSDMSGT